MQPRVARTPSTKHLSFLLPTKAALQDKQFSLPVFFLDGKETENHIPIAQRPTVQSIHQYLWICLMEAQYSQELLNWELQGGCKAEQRTSN